jgi:Antirepressor regulating drug resistance, predicted signal transduction N-terminal membrane component
VRYKALVLVVLVFLIPWVWLKGIYSYVVRWFLQVRVPVVNGHPVAIADIVTAGEAYKTPDYRWELVVLGIWLIGALGFVLYKAATYFHSKRRLLSVSRKCDDPDLNEIVERLRKELHYKGRFEVYLTPGRNTTFTLGAMRPVVFLQEEYLEGQLYYIMKHEMTHMVRKDLLLKLLLECVCCLHWFNVLVYFLNDQFDNACEASCDERVLAGCTEDERRAYSKLLVDNLKRLKEQIAAPRKRIPFENGLGDAYEKTKERVNLIMKAKEVGNWRKGLAAGMFAVLLVANSFTALAYPNVYRVEDEKADVAEDTIDGNAFWAGEFLGDGYRKAIADVVYDDEFIDAEGNVSPITSYAPYVFCIKHDIVSGYYQTHRKNDAGGCTVKVFESTKCLNCNTIWIGDLFSTTTYVKCPH